VRRLAPFVATLTLIHAAATLNARQKGTSSMAYESARQVPVIHETDVLVVGGSSGGVSAALAAAKAGADVFVVAQETYFGADLCGTFRLWLEPDETPRDELALAVFTAPSKRAQPPVAGLPFTYETSLPSAGKHPDTRPPRRLCDGRWQDAPRQSVQYDGDVTITVDLGKRASFAGVSLFVYQRPADFVVAEAAVSVSDDKQDWRPLGTIKNADLGRACEGDAMRLRLAAAAEARYVRLDVKRAPECERILLAELAIEKEAVEETAPADVPRYPPTPMHVKRTLDRALIDAEVPFLFGCYPSDILRDASGRPAGIVVVNRSGRHAIRARVIVDATPRAVVARLAGANFSPYPSGAQTFRRIVVGGEPPAEFEGERGELPAPVITSRGKTATAYEYTLRIPMRDGSFASFAAAEQEARDRTWHRDQLEASETLFQVPPDVLTARAARDDAWSATVSLGVFEPADVDGVYVLGGCAAVSRVAAAELLRPLNYMECGRRIGAAPAKAAKGVKAQEEVRVAGVPAPKTSGIDLRERTEVVRGAKGHVPSAMRGVPVIGSYDIVVVGGGTGGAPAGIGAARKGARTLVVEYLYDLGGVGTAGLISVYYHGNRVGFTTEIDEGVAAMGGGKARRGWKPERKMEWYRREIRKAGGDIWFGSLGCGAYMEGGRVRGVVVATSHGRGVVLAKAVVDATGAAAVASAAGAPCVFTDGSGFALQGTGLPPRELGAEYTNTDYTFVDDEDPVDICRAFVHGREKFKDAYDMGQLIDTRERRQILGEWRITPLDIHLGRTYRDTVTIHASNFDSHGYTVFPMFFVWPPDKAGFRADVPLRALLPSGIEGMLVTGLGISGHRDAMPILRMQPDIQNQGYACGVAAAMASARNVGIREIDIKALQRHLVEKAILPERVLTDRDAEPPSGARIEKAVSALAKEMKGLPVILANPDVSVPVLKKTYLGADDADYRLVLAQVLASLNDATGVETLIEAVNAQPWDKGWRFRGMGQFGRSASAVDGLIIALGRAGDAHAVPAIVEKVKQLTPEHALSHHRAVSEALERFKDAGAARPLAELLGKSGMTGHAMTNLGGAMSSIPASRTDNTSREVSLRELMLARALYRCGDHDGLGEKILRQYASDLRGHYARHARAVLGKMLKG